MYMLTHNRPRNFGPLIFFKIHTHVKIGILRGLSLSEFFYFDPNLSETAKNATYIHIYCIRAATSPRTTVCEKKMYTPVGRTKI